MNKLAKRISAVVLAGAMTLSSSIAAFAADMTVYIRTYNDTTKAFEFYAPETVKDVNSSQTLYQALSTYFGNRAEWTKGTADDGTVDQYLNSLVVKGQSEAWATKGEYKDCADDFSTGTWIGQSWMWCKPDSSMTEPLKNVNYPSISLSRQHCSDSDFSIILSYDTQTYTW